jgi:hypothetical protein
MHGRMHHCQRRLPWTFTSFHWRVRARSFEKGQSTPRSMQLVAGKFKDHTAATALEAKARVSVTDSLTDLTGLRHCECISLGTRRDHACRIAEGAAAWGRVGCRSDSCTRQLSAVHGTANIPQLWFSPSFPYQFWHRREGSESVLLDLPV